MKRLFLVVMLVFLLVLSIVSVFAQDGFIRYTVRRGDNLFRIALNHNTTVARLAQINNIADVTRIYAGQVLLIPITGSSGNPNPSGGATPTPTPRRFRDGEANWCYKGEPWGDGRCDSPDSSVHNYNWFIGWCQAQIELGKVQSLEQCEAEPTVTPTPEEKDKEAEETEEAS